MDRLWTESLTKINSASRSSLRDCAEFETKVVKSHFKPSCRTVSDFLLLSTTDKSKASNSWHVQGRRLPFAMPLLPASADSERAPVISETFGLPAVILWLNLHGGFALLECLTELFQRLLAELCKQQQP